jgi:hypothetical protein
VGWQSNIFPLLIVTPTGGFTGLFVYSPGPGHGNLIASTTSAAGTDPYGNAFLGASASYASSAGIAAGYDFNGVTTYTGPVGGGGPWASFWSFGRDAASGNIPSLGGAGFELNELAVPAPAAHGPVLFGKTSGHAAVVSDALHGDGNTYDIETLHLTTTADQNVPVTSGTIAVTGLTTSLAANTRYRVRGRVKWQMGATAVAQSFGFGGTVTTSFVEITENQQQVAAAVAGNWTQIAALSLTASPVFAANTPADFIFDGTIETNAAGTFQVQVSSGAQPFIIRRASFCDLEPCT